MAKKDEKQLPMDIPTLQSMVRKRNSIIAEMKSISADIIPAETSLLMQDHDDLKADYHHCCVQLKARDGEIKRINEVLDARCKEYDELAKLYDANVKQLDQESDSNASLEDQITAVEAKAGLEAMKKDKGYFIGKTAEDYENEIKELEDKIKASAVMIPITDSSLEAKDLEIKLLQEKLALCDEWYRKNQGKLRAIQEIINDDEGLKATDASV